MSSRIAKELTEIKILMNLQLFADDSGKDDGSGGNDSKEKQQSTFDELLKKGHQSEFDRRLQKSIQTALSNERKRLNMLSDDKISEVERMAKMNAQECAEYERDKALKKLRELEREIWLAGMVKTAKGMLGELGVKIPDELVAAFVVEDVEQTKMNIAEFAIAFTNAVKQVSKAVPKDEISKLVKV